jgi:hypothetical protein
VVGISGSRSARPAVAAPGFSIFSYLTEFAARGNPEDL